MLKGSDMFREAAATMVESYEVRLIEAQRPVHTPDEIGSYLNSPENVMWVRARDLLGALYESCVDGREDGCIVGTPGGDIFLLTEAIISLGSVARKHLSDAEISKVLGWYLDRFGSFYMHTDTHGLEHLRKILNDDSRFGKFSTPEEVLALVQNPPREQQLSLLEHLTDPETIGCGHLKLMLKNPETYGVSRKVITGLMRAFFNVMWNGTEEQKQKLVYRVLEGEHREGAVVEIRIPGEVDEDTWVPMVKPANGKVSMFVVHPQVVQWMHRQVGMALVESGLFPEVKVEVVEDLYSRMNEMLGEGVRETVSMLAFHLPAPYVFELVPKLN